MFENGIVRIILMCLIAFTSMADSYRFMYPGGAEHIAMGHTGAANVEGLHSVFYNPAHVSQVGISHDTRIRIEDSYSNALPSLGIVLRCNFSHIGYYHYDRIDNWDLGFQISQRVSNFVEGEYGFGSWYEFLGNSENSIAFNTGATYKNRLQFGIGIVYSTLNYPINNFSNSELSKESMVTFAIGGIYKHRFSTSRKIFCEANYGLSLLGLGDNKYEFKRELWVDSTFVESNPVDTSYRVIKGGASLHLTKRHYGAVTFAIDYGKYLGNELGYASSFGQSISFNPVFTFNQGFLFDSESQRKECNFGGVLEFNKSKLIKAKNRTFKYDNNFSMQYAMSIICALGDNSIHQNEMVHQVSLGFSF